MKTYLVGGVVRDRLLGVEPKDCDFVITGCTPEEMDALPSLRRVGKDFPIWVDKNNNEYALARREREGGVAQFDPSVTIEEDLGKRDLTINAMAIDVETGELIDPYGGQADLQNKILRCVSTISFAEDPIRVFRVARFAAKYPDFTIDDETHVLMYNLYYRLDYKEFQPDRIWKEISRGLMESHPSRMLEVLWSCRALLVAMPEVFKLSEVSQPEEWHPEGDVFTHTKQVLQYTADNNMSLEVRFAAMVHDVGKGLTHSSRYPHHYGHEGSGVPLVKKICERLKVPSKLRDVAVLVCQEHGNIHGAMKLKTTSIVKVLRRCDAFRRPERFEFILQACLADARGRDGRYRGKHHFTDAPYPQALRLNNALKAAQLVDTRKAAEQVPSVEHIPMAIHAARARAIRQSEMAAINQDNQEQKGN